MGVPRKNAATMIAAAMQRANQAETLQELVGQKFSLLHTLHVTGPDASLYALLARISLEKQQLNKAVYFARCSLAINPENRMAQEVMAQLDMGLQTDNEH